MAKSSKSKSSSPSKKPAAKSSKPAKKTEVRNTAAPRASKGASIAVKPVEVSQEMIAQRAYDIHLSGTGGSQDENWHRAERELRGL